MFLQNTGNHLQGIRTQKLTISVELSDMSVFYKPLVLYIRYVLIKCMCLIEGYSVFSKHEATFTPCYLLAGHKVTNEASFLKFNYN
jgi:hypothetical protein